MPGVKNDTPFEKELIELLNRHCMENGSNTPDWILGYYLYACLHAFNGAICSRENWYGRGNLKTNEKPLN